MTVGSFAPARAAPSRRAKRPEDAERSFNYPPRSTPTLTPDLAFEHCANTAAAAAAQAPPYISYRVDTHVSAPSLGKSRDIIREVSVRTQDDVAVIQDLPQGENQLGYGFPITPSFDALSYFTLTWRVGARMQMTSYVHDVTPLTYQDPQPGQSDVVVMRLRQYKAEYADDSSDAPGAKTHISLVPFDFVKRQVTKPDDTFFLSDVFVDNTSGLPSEIRYSGADDVSFVIDYGIVEQHWVITQAHYEETLHG